MHEYEIEIGQTRLVVEILSGSKSLKVRFESPTEDET